MARAAWFRTASLVSVAGTLVSGVMLVRSYQDHQSAGEAIAEQRQGMSKDKEEYDRTGVYVITPEMRTTVIKDWEVRRKNANEAGAISQIALALSLFLPFTLYFTISWITTGSLREKGNS